jgi:hypothetical protein
MEFVIVKINSELWNQIWDELENHPINNNIVNPSVAENDGYSWEYRGSFKKEHLLISEFLHRKHPVTNSLYKVVFKREIDDDSEIYKRIKIK